jgi:hypothetical protein
MTLLAGFLGDGLHERPEWFPATAWADLVEEATRTINTKLDGALKPPPLAELLEAAQRDWRAYLPYVGKAEEPERAFTIAPYAVLGLLLGDKEADKLGIADVSGYLAEVYVALGSIPKERYAGAPPMPVVKQTRLKLPDPAVGAKRLQAKLPAKIATEGKRMDGARLRTAWLRQALPAAMRAVGHHALTQEWLVKATDPKQFFVPRGATPEQLLRLRETPGVTDALAFPAIEAVYALRS